MLLASALALPGCAQAVPPTPRAVWHYDTQCPGTNVGEVAGCAVWPDESGRVDVYVSPYLAYYEDDVAWHEAGHVYDFLAMPEWVRVAWAKLNRRAGDPWWGGDNPPGEQFAESYRMCALHSREFQSYGYYPGPRRLRKTCDLLDRAARFSSEVRASRWVRPSQRDDRLHAPVSCAPDLILHHQHTNRRHNAP